MAKLSELYQKGDWKTEKHSPIIDGPDTVKKGEFTRFSFSVGKEVAHPNKTEHHIRWIDVYFYPDGEKFPIHVGKTEFNAHGASASGPDTSSVYTFHEGQMSFKTDKPGTLMASSYCNVHGLWESSKKISVS